MCIENVVRDLQDENGEDGDDMIENEEFAWDDVNNMELPIKEVRAARAEEMAHMKGKIFKVVPRSECYDRTGRAPISTKWVDTDKSHGQGQMRVRSRWVARDFMTRGERDREDLFCATPPLELLRFLVSRMVTTHEGDQGRRRKMLFIDVRKPHLVPECSEDVYVELPVEAQCGKGECGKLVHWLYGCRRAEQAWEDHYAGVLGKAGFLRGAASPVSFFNANRMLWCIVHGDDFTFTGYDEDLDYATEIMEAAYELKVRGRLGNDARDVQEIDVLGRVIKCADCGCSWQADPRHRRLILEHFGFDEKTKVLTTNGVKEIATEGGKTRPH